MSSIFSRFFFFFFQESITIGVCISQCCMAKMGNKLCTTTSFILFFFFGIEVNPERQNKEVLHNRSEDIHHLQPSRPDLYQGEIALWGEVWLSSRVAH